MCQKCKLVDLGIDICICINQPWIFRRITGFFRCNRVSQSALEQLSFVGYEVKFGDRILSQFCNEGNNKLYNVFECPFSYGGEEERV
jgi:hypothetical protein